MIARHIILSFSEEVECFLDFFSSSGLVDADVSDGSQHGEVDDTILVLLVVLHQLDELIIDDVNRVTPEKTAGGKGLNVARVLGQLGDDVVATGLLGGHMGAYMAELMDANGIKNDFVPIKGETRICLNILHAGNQTELLESRQVTLSKKGEDKGVRLSFEDFPYLIVWSKPEGDFVAVEPWGGLSTCSDEDDVLEHKRGCLVAKPKETVVRSFTIEIL